MKKIITLIFILISFGMSAQLKTVSNFKKDFEKIVEFELTKEQLNELFQEYYVIFTQSDSFYELLNESDPSEYSLINFKEDTLYQSNIDKLLNSKNQYNRALAYFLVGVTNDKSKEKILLNKIETEEDELPVYAAINTLQKFSDEENSAEQKSEREKLNKQTAKINIKWTDNLDGDFSFKNRWQYEQSTINVIVKTEALMVLGNGDEEALSKKWEKRENELSTDEMYSNTMHYPYTLQTNGESEQLDYILAEQIDSNTVECQSSGNTVVDEVGDAWLNLNIVENECYPIIGFTKYNIHKDFLVQKRWMNQYDKPDPFETIYPCTEGSITIDKPIWDRGWLKASFSFVFNSFHSGNFTLSGNIFTPIRYKELKGEPLMKYDEEQYLYRLRLSSKYDIPKYY